MAAQQLLQSRPQRVVAHLGQPIQLVEQFFDGQHDRRALLLLEGGERIQRRSGHGVPGGAHRPGHAAAQRAVEAVNPPRPLLPRIVPPAADFVDQHAGGQRGPADPRHLRGRQRRGAPRRTRRAAARIDSRYAGRPCRGSSTRPSAPRKVRILIASKCSAARSSRRLRSRTQRSAERSARRVSVGSLQWPVQSRRTAAAAPPPPGDRREPRRPTPAARRCARRTWPATAASSRDRPPARTG